MVNGDQYGREVDIWGLGVLLFEFLVGFPPFEAEGQQKVSRMMFFIRLFMALRFRSPQ
jgi:serine/threonine protein kinase